MISVRRPLIRKQAKRCRSSEVHFPRGKKKSSSLPIVSPSRLCVHVSTIVLAAYRLTCPRLYVIFVIALDVIASAANGGAAERREQWRARRGSTAWYTQSILQRISKPDARCSNRSNIFRPRARLCTRFCPPMPRTLFLHAFISISLTTRQNKLEFNLFHSRPPLPSAPLARFEPGAWKFTRAGR